MEQTNPEVTIEIIKERMKQRAEDVATRAEERRAAKDTNSSSAETMDYFYDSFSSMKEKFAKDISQVAAIKSENLQHSFDSLLLDLQTMQQYLNESSMFLPSYQIKKAQETIDSLNQTLTITMEESNPKKKFGFRSKKPAQDKKPTSTVDTIDSLSQNLENKIALDDIIRQSFFGFRDLTDCELMKAESELKDRQINLLNLINCKVIALGNPGSLQISNLNNCIVVIGPTSRSAFIKDCQNCKFVLACQQVRIHNSKDTDFYIHVTGAAIIENCKNLHFAPYNLNYPDMDKHYLQSQLNLEINNWNKVEDFHWLNENEKSPNFSLIDPKDMQTDWF